MARKEIALYGQAGVGTTTLAVNIAAALAEAGEAVFLVGIDSRGAATTLLRRGRPLLPLSEALTRSSRPKLAELTAVGFKGARCLEAGDIGSPAQLRAVLDLLQEVLAAEEATSYILYDLACEAERELALLLEALPITRLLAVSTADRAPLATVNRALRLPATRALPEGVLLAGNQLPGAHAEAMIDDFGRRTALPVVAYHPRSLVTTRSAFFGETVLEAAPLSQQAYYYRRLARMVGSAAPENTVPPVALDDTAFEEWALDWGERLFDYGEGLVRGGEAI